LNNLDHIAFILDGNKRWAKKNNFSNFYGYSKGFENIKNLVNFALNIKLKNLTLYALSSENFHRSSLDIIYEIIYKNFAKYFNDLVTNNGVKIKIFGSRNNLPKKILDIFENIESLSLNNNSLNLNIAFNYGFKHEIKKVLNKVKDSSLEINLNNEQEIDKLFDIGTFPDPDILIRTGGYKRLSNFIMYNLTYTELFFTNTLWPDFSEKEFHDIIKKYSNISRKYGL
tara:strand:+ start:253 stop:933 length:681 start_codon:yes stop_codon:yes gene_type:complete